MNTVTAGAAVKNTENPPLAARPTYTQSEDRGRYILLTDEYDSLKEALRKRKLDATMKRALDIAGALALLVLLLPLFVMLAIAIKLTSKGPIFFRQRRIGYNGREFDFLKFRSMRPDQEKCVDVNAVKDMQARGVLLKGKSDPRVTKIGALMRRTSLDELPQLINVLRGDMSLVGPRPLIPFMLDQHKEFNLMRSLVKPGLSGLWQIRARKFNTSADYMIVHDLEYVKNCSFWLDIKILCSTLPAVIKGDGAH
jgi:exopolysaccharide production protein ExoY